MSYMSEIDQARKDGVVLTRMKCADGVERWICTACLASYVNRLDFGHEYGCAHVDHWESNADERHHRHRDEATMSHDSQNENDPRCAACNVLWYEHPGITLTCASERRLRKALEATMHLAATYAPNHPIIAEAIAALKASPE